MAAQRQRAGAEPLLPKTEKTPAANSQKKTFKDAIAQQILVPEILSLGVLVTTIGVLISQTYGRLLISWFFILSGTSFVAWSLAANVSNYFDKGEDALAAILSIVFTVLVGGLLTVLIYALVYFSPT